MRTYTKSRRTAVRRQIRNKPEGSYPRPVLQSSRMRRAWRTDARSVWAPKGPKQVPLSFSSPGQARIDFAAVASNAHPKCLRIGRLVDEPGCTSDPAPPRTLRSPVSRPRPDHSSNAPFPTTRWSRVLAAGDRRRPVGARGAGRSLQGLLVSTLCVREAQGASARGGRRPRPGDIPHPARP